MSEVTRARALMAIDEADALTLVGPDGTLRRLEGDTAELARAILDHCARAPRTRAEILAHVEALTGAPLEDASIVDALVALLREAGALVAPKPAPTPSSGARVLVCLGGAVAAAHAPALIQHLHARGFDVRVVATENALRFVARDALEALTHRAVFSSFRQRDEGVRVPHIELAAWPDVVLVWPATAALVHRIATGDCSELAGAIAITTRAPVLVAPSMNTAMHDAPSVQRNLETLRADGFALTASTFALEVADAPGDRAPRFGGAPGPAELAVLVRALLRARGPAAPRDAAGWEALHRVVPEREQPWFTDAIDVQVARAIEALALAPGLLWDLGTGNGACAVWGAARGFSVVATDVSATALDRARARAGDAAIVFLVDDVTQSALRCQADVVVDRGTLHSLPVEARSAWARTVRERTRPGAVVIVKAHAPPGDPRVSSQPVSQEALTELLGDAFALELAEPGAFEGTLDPAPAAMLYVLRRRAL